MGLAGVLAGLLAMMLGGCDSLFYQPSRAMTATPENIHLAYSDLWLESPGQPKLHGWLLPAKGPRKGWVVVFHGNAANISNHMYGVHWLPGEGYSVMVWDYRGYGRSAGEPDREGLVNDGERALAKARELAGNEPLFVYGQSLGGAVALATLGKTGITGLNGLILESTFGSYRAMAREKMSELWPLWPIQYPLSWLLISEEWNGEDPLPKLAALPLLVAHQVDDPVVSFDNGKRLFDSFPGADKTFLPLDEDGHISVFAPKYSPYRKPLLDWMDKRRQRTPAP